MRRLVQFLGDVIYATREGYLLYRAVTHQPTEDQQAAEVRGNIRWIAQSLDMICCHIREIKEDSATKPKEKNVSN